MSAVLIGQHNHAAQATTAMNTYAKKLAELDNAAVDKLHADLNEYNKKLQATTIKDPYQPGGLSAPSPQYSKLLGGTGDSQVMGWLSVPSINLTDPIYYGQGELYPSSEIQHIASTAIPDDIEGIHSVLVGHSGLNTSVLFTHLDQVKKGDTFSVRILNMNLRYTVDNISTVDPDDMGAIKAVAGHNYMTLLTCTPIGVNSHRLLVRGELTSVDFVTNGTTLFATPFDARLIFVPAVPVAAAAVVIILRARRNGVKKRGRRRMRDGQ